MFPPWLVRAGFHRETGDDSLHAQLQRLVSYETAEAARIQALYAELNDEVYRLYGIPDTTRKTIEETLGERPTEVPWPQMEGKTTEQKCIEHIWRLLSYAVKRVLEADDDGIVCFNAVNGEPRLAERVRHELTAFFPGRDANDVGVEIVNELRKTVKG